LSARSSVANTARAIAAEIAGLAILAWRAGAATVDVRFGAVPYAVGATSLSTDVAMADEALTILAGRAGRSGAARRAVRAAAVERCLVAVQCSIAALRVLAESREAVARRAVVGREARLARTAGGALPTAVDVRFIAVLATVRTRGRAARRAGTTAVDLGFRAVELTVAARARICIALLRQQIVQIREGTGAHGPQRNDAEEQKDEVSCPQSYEDSAKVHCDEQITVAAR
jgi:hypothetical protein